MYSRLLFFHTFWELTKASFSANANIDYKGKRFCSILCLFIACLSVISPLQVHAQVAGDYQSVASGSWTNAATWERYDGSTWVTTGTAPSSGDGVITIRNGHTVTISSGTVTTDQTVVAIGGTLTINGGTISLNNGTGIDLDMNGTMNFTSGTVTGAGLLSVASGGTFNWTNGTMNGTGTSEFLAGSIVNRNVGGSAIIGGDGNLRTLNNYSNSFTLLANINLTGQFGTGATFNNVGIINIPGDFSVTCANNSAFLNYGTINKTAGTGTTVLGTLAPTNYSYNLGVINVSSGKVSVQGNATHSGEFHANAGTTIEFAGGTMTFGTTSSFTGNGNILFNGGFVTLASGCTCSFAASLTVTQTVPVTWDATTTLGTYLLSHNMSGSGTVSIANSFSWNSGIMNGSGTTTILSTATALKNGSASSLGGTRTFSNQTNSFTLSESISLSGSLGNAPTFSNSGTVTIAGDYHIGNSVTGILTNTGTITKSSGTGTSVLGNATTGTFNNSGVINANSGTIRIDYTSGTFAGAVNITSGATLNRPTATSFTGTNFTNNGTTVGTTSFSNSGTYKGNGTFSGSVFTNATSGIVSPGSSPGCQTFSNGFTSSGNVNIEVNGTVTACNDYDKITVTGTATLGGTLNVTVGFTPTNGDQITIITATTISGTFATLNAPAGWTVNYNSPSTGMVTLLYNLCVQPDIPQLSTATTCAGQNVALSVTSGNLNGAIDWHWYAGSCGGTPVGTGGTINVAPTSATTYFVRGEGGCATLGMCAQTTVNVTQPVVPSVSIAITAGINPTCVGGDVTFTATPINGGAAPSYQWKRGVTNVGTNSPTYIDGGLTAGAISVVMTTSLSCITSATATSNVINLTTVSNSWTGAVSTKWNTPANWCAIQVPSATEDALIPSGLTNYPMLQTDVTIKNLTLQTGATIDLNGKALTIVGSKTGGGSFKGSSASGLILNGSAGILNFVSGFGELKTLTLGNNASATLGSPLLLTSANFGGVLTVNTGATFNTGGLLTIGSSVNGTAQVASSAGTINGNVTVERFIPWLGHRAWLMLAVPTSGSQTFKQAWQEGAASINDNPNPGYGTLLTSTTGGNGYDAATPGNSLLSFTPGNPGTWTGVSSTNVTINTTSGYMIYVRGERTAMPNSGVAARTSTTLRTNGALYQGTQSAINVTGGVNVLVGNVYASAIDFGNITKTNLANSFKVWDPKLVGSNNIGAYQTFAFPSFAPVPGGGSYANVATNTRIESGQAFSVSSIGGGSIQLTEASKTSGSRNIVFRGQQQYQTLNVTLNAIVNGTPVLADGNAVYFSAAFSDEINNEDATKLSNFGENFGILRNTIPLAVETRTTADTIFYKMWNLKPQQYQLQFVAADFDTTLLSAVLEDNFLNFSTPVALHDTVSVLFDITTNTASSAQDRFRLVFVQKQVLPVGFVSIHVNKHGASTKVEWKVAQEKGIKMYEIERSANGREFLKLATVNAFGNGSIQQLYSWTDEQPLHGVSYYRVRSVDRAGNVKYSAAVRVVFDAKADFVIMPNPVKDGRINIQFENQTAGRYDVEVLNEQGQVVMKHTVIHYGGDNVYTVVLPASVASSMYTLQILKPDNGRESKTIVVASGK